MDFQERLADYIDSLNLGIPLFNDTNDTDASISLYSLPGSNVIRTYYDGTTDKRLNYELQVKAPITDRDKAVSALTTISSKLESLERLESSDGSFLFNSITVSSEVYLNDATTDGNIYFRTTFIAEITHQGGNK